MLTPVDATKRIIIYFYSVQFSIKMFQCASYLEWVPDKKPIPFSVPVFPWIPLGRALGTKLTQSVAGMLFYSQFWPDLEVYVILLTALKSAAGWVINLLPPWFTPSVTNTATRSALLRTVDSLKSLEASAIATVIKVAPRVRFILLIWSLTPTRDWAPAWSKLLTFVKRGSWSKPNTTICAALFLIVNSPTNSLRNVWIWVKLSIKLPETSTAIAMSSALEHTKQKRENIRQQLYIPARSQSVYHSKTICQVLCWLIQAV